MIFGSTLLEVVIGVVFVYLLLSGLCSAFTELTESFIRFRARDLEKGIGKLLSHPDLAKEFFAHPLIKPLGERPSYIPADTFSLALWNLATTAAARGQEAAGVTQDLNTIRELIVSLNDEKYKTIKTSLLTLIDEAGGDINRARQNIREWYDDAMNRVSGWYKRRTTWILVLVGLFSASFFNVDTISVTRVLWYNDTLRRTVVAAAEDYAKTSPTPGPHPAGTSEDAIGTAEEQAKAVRKRINEVRGELNNLGLLFGWGLRKPDEPRREDEKYKGLTNEAFDQEKRRYKELLAEYNADLRRLPENPSGWLLKALGIFLTALAVSQGAPFWFDLLNKFIVIRSTVKPGEKSPVPPSKDKPVHDTNKDRAEGLDRRADASYRQKFK